MVAKYGSKDDSMEAVAKEKVQQSIKVGEAQWQGIMAKVTQ